MLTRMLITPSLASSAAVLLGLFSQPSAATEEILVLGADMTEARQTLFRSEIDEYVRSLNEQIKGTLDKDLQRVSAPKLLLAESETPTRG
jgi:hypothetical protein